MLPLRIPFALRLAAAVICGLAILYLSLAPVSALPRVQLWDKAEHAIAYAALTLAWLSVFPRRPVEVIGAIFALGVGIELAQASMHFGRAGDLLDAVANSAGILAGLAAARLTRSVLAR